MPYMERLNMDETAERAFWVQQRCGVFKWERCLMFSNG